MRSNGVRKGKFASFVQGHSGNVEQWRLEGDGADGARSTVKVKDGGGAHLSLGTGGEDKRSE